MTQLKHRPPTPITMEWLAVENRRLEGILKDKIHEVQSLRSEVASLTSMLGQAEAGMELADLIKRMLG